MSTLLAYDQALLDILLACENLPGLVNVRSFANKAFILNDFFTARQLDFLHITETWQSADELSSFSKLRPPAL